MICAYHTYYYIQALTLTEEGVWISHSEYMQDMRCNTRYGWMDVRLFEPGNVDLGLTSVSSHLIYVATKKHQEARKLTLIYPMKEVFLFIFWSGLAGSGWFIRESQEKEVDGRVAINEEILSHLRSLIIWHLFNYNSVF